MKRVYRLDGEGFFVESLDIYPQLVSVETFPVIPGKVQEDGTIGEPTYSNEWVEQFVYTIPEDCVEVAPPSEYKVQWVDGVWIQHNLPPTPPPEKTDYDTKLEEIIETNDRLQENLNGVATDAKQLTDKALELNTETMMAVTEFYEQQQIHDNDSQEESMITMLALTEVFESQIFATAAQEEVNLTTMEGIAEVYEQQAVTSGELQHAHEHIHQIGQVSEQATEKSSESVAMSLDAMVGLSTVYENQMVSDERCLNNADMIMLGLVDAYEQQLEDSEQKEASIELVLDELNDIGERIEGITKDVTKVTETDLTIMLGLTELYELILALHPEKTEEVAE